MNSGQYFFDDGKSRKFWAYAQRGRKLVVRHGRIGSEGRETEKAFPSPAAAAAATENLIRQKVRKGYARVDSTKLKIKRPSGKRKATDRQIEKLEEQLQATLPAEYRQFLLTQNGGEPEPYYVQIPGHPYIANVAVGFLLGLYPKDEPYGLTYAVQNTMPLLPKGQLPIAGDGDIFTIALTPKNNGCIYFWDHEAPDCEDEDEDGNIKFKMAHGTLLAGSFNEFLTRISMFGDV